MSVRVVSIQVHLTKTVNERDPSGGYAYETSRSSGEIEGDVQDQLNSIMIEEPTAQFVALIPASTTKNTTKYLAIYNIQDADILRKG